MKKSFLSLLFVFLFSLSCFAEYYSFAVFGDVQGRETVFNDIISSINRDKSIKFAILTGDITGRGTPAEFAEYKKLKDRSAVPIYEVMGNHDIGRFYQGRKEFIKLYKERYYSFDIENIRYIMLDTSSDLGLGSGQWKWLKEQLSTSKIKLVFMHRPLVDASGSFPGHVMYPKSERIKLNDLLVAKKVKYVFSGHIHGYGREMENGVVYIVTAGGGANLYLPAFAGGFYHYVKVTVDDDKITDEVVKLYEN
jgi:3',5'-cyclic AMP phosphodiesterase CpdA